MLNTKLGFFYVHSFAHLINEVTKSYTKFTAVFSQHYIWLDRVDTIMWFGDFGKQTAVLVFRKRTCLYQPNHIIVL